MTRRGKLIVFLLPTVAIAVSTGWMWWTHISPEQRLQSALVALAKDDYQEVHVQVQYLRKDPRFAQHVSLLNAGLLLKFGRYEAALAEVAGVSLPGELHMAAMLISGESLYRLGRLTESEQIMRQLAGEHPDHPEAHRMLAEIYYDLGAMDQAIAELERLIPLVPDDFRPHRFLGLIYHDFEKYTQATVHFRKAISLKPTAAVHKEIVRELAQSLVRQRDYESALEILESADDEAHLMALKSECYWSLGWPVEARQWLDRVRKLDSDERSVMLLDGRMHLDAGDAKAAIGPLKRVLSRDPHDYECRYQLALAYRRLGQTDRYETEIAQMTVSQGLYKRLAKLSNQAILRPRDAGIRDELADVCRKLGKQELAGMWSKAADIRR